MTPYEIRAMEAINQTYREVRRRCSPWSPLILWSLLILLVLIYASVIGIRNRLDDEHAIAMESRERLRQTINAHNALATAHDELVDLWNAHMETLQHGNALEAEVR